MTVKLSDVIRDLRTNASFAILLAAAWLLTSVSYENALRMREQTRDLVAFLLLRDALTPVAQEDDEWPSFGERKTKACREIVVNRSEANVCEDMTIRAPWDPELMSNVVITAHPSRAVEHFAFIPVFDNQFLPFSRYVIGKSGKQLRILKKLPYLGPRNVTDNMLLNDRTHSLIRSPVYWSQISVILNAMGNPATKIEDVKISDPSVGKLITDYLSVQAVRESIAGLSVPIFLIPFGLAALLLITGMLLIGSWAAFRLARAQPPDEELGWVMLHVSPDRLSNYVAIGASCFLAIGLFTVPAAALVRTIQMLRSSDPYQPALWMLGCVLMLNMVIFVATMVEQLRLRQAIAARAQPMPVRLSVDE